jgi:hypothetical protein
MSEYRFNPPLTLKGNIVVHNLDDAVRFMIAIAKRAVLRYRRACFIVSRELLANQGNAKPVMPFLTGRRRST